jgi:hypothetical protein
MSALVNTQPWDLVFQCLVEYKATHGVSFDMNDDTSERKTHKNVKSS